MTLTIAILLIALVMLIPLALRPSLTLKRVGRMFAFLAIVVVPVTAGFAGLQVHVEHSKTVAFCTSCHVMEKYGRSLHIDDLDHVPGKHWQYGRVPRETACFACHTNYTLYGDYTAKLRGLRHVYAQYLGTIPAKITLYTPYNNRECLHCHRDARSFVDAVSHKSDPAVMQAILENRTSCLTKGCHEVVHTVDKVDALPAWPAAAKDKEKSK